MSGGTEVRVAVVGYGAGFYMGRSHLRRIAATPGLRAVAVCDTEGERLAEARRDFPQITTFCNLDEALGSSGADLFVIVTPNHTHFDLALRCMQAGKHVLIEKPMCLTSAEAAVLIGASREARVMLTVYQIRRLDGDFLALREAVQSGRVGTVYHVELTRAVVEAPIPGWRTRRSECGGPVHDWGSHMVDWLVDLLASPPTEVSAFFRSTRCSCVEVEDHADVFLRFANGVTAALQIANQAFVPRPMWRILADRGGLLLHSPDQPQIEVWRDGQSGTVTERIAVQPGMRHLFYPNVAAHLLTGAPLLVEPAVAGLVVAVLEACNTSAQTRLPVSVSSSADPTLLNLVQKGERPA